MYLLLLLAAGIGSAALATFAWRNRRYPGFTYLAVLELAVTWWIGCYLGERLDPAHAETWFALKYPAIGLVAPSWLLFTLYQMGERPQSRGWWAVYAWPLILGPLAYSNATHRLLFSGIVQRGELVGLNGPLYSLHLAIDYTFFLVAAALLLRDWQRRSSIQSGLLLVGGVIPFAGNVANELAKATDGIGSWLPFGPALPAFAVGALIIGASAARFRQLDPRPVARERLFDSLPDAVLVLNETDVIVDANRAARQMLGLATRDLLGLTWPQVFKAPDWRAIPHGPDATVEREWPGSTGGAWLELQRHNLFDAHGRAVGLLMVARDITARKQFESELRAQSYRDRLTGLANRRFFDDEAARLQASREFPVSVFAFDLDGLKQVNDREGHAAGDLLLQAMSAFLTGFFRAGDRVIRQGGDEFVVLLPATSVDEAERIRSRLGAALAQFNQSRSLPLRFSTGLSVAADAADWASAIRRADERLYEAKRLSGAVPV
ncbi:MAG: diguanylate cyclase [Vicinamibacterales bacterium]